MSCSPTREVSCGSAGKVSLYKPGFIHLYLKHSLLDIYSLRNTITELQTVEKDPIIKDKTHFILDSLQNYVQGVENKLRIKYMAYASSPCDLNEKGLFDQTIIDIVEENESFINTYSDFNISQNNTVRAHSGFNTWDIDKHFNEFFNLFFYNYPKKDDFPENYNEDSVRDLQGFEFKLIKDLNSQSISYTATTKDGITYTTTSYKNLEMNNYNHIGLISLLISWPYKSGGKNLFRIQFIAKKEYEKVEQLQDPDETIQNEADKFVHRMLNRLNK